ncbi:MAG: hypothetical protein ACOX6O_11000 [Christensenellales bacterium]|jgi:hypothetical protein
MDTTFIAGMHVVGKCTLCNGILNELLISAFITSNMISQVNKEHNDENKTDPDIVGNQAMQRILKKHGYHNL